nr:hypothetical protein [Acidimicrobiia bacterium]
APVTTVEITAPPTTVTTPATSAAAAAAVETAPATTVSPTTTTTPPSTAPTLPEVPDLPTDLTRPVRIVVAGDSTASALGGGMQVWAAYHPDVAQVEVRWAPGCGMLRRGFAPAGVIEPNCSNMHAALAADLLSIQPDVVVVMVTVGDVYERIFDEAVGPIGPDDPRFEAELRAGYEDELAELQAAGVGHVAWMIAPPPEVYWQGDMARMIEPPRFRVLRRVIEEFAAAHPDIVRVVDLTAWPAAMEHGARPDGLHFSFEVAAALSETYVGPIVVSVALS